MKRGSLKRVLCGLFVFSCTLCLSWTLMPEGLSFGPQLVGTTSPAQYITVYNNNSSHTIQVSSITLSLPEFTLVNTKLPVTISAGQFASFQIVFTPDAIQTYNCRLTVTVGAKRTGMNIIGVGASATAAASLNTNSLSFPNQPVGTSASQNLVISNTGTSSFNVTGVVLTYPFSQNTVTGSTTITPGSALTVPITYFPTNVATNNGTVLVNYDSLPSSGVALTGNGIVPASLTINTYPTLPAVPKSAAYQATLSTMGGVSPVSWSLASGSSLPSGLSLSSNGTISGTIGSVAPANYSFTVRATDSNSPPATATATLTVPVIHPTGANCSDISFDVAGTSDPLVPINDLGTNYYLGIAEGGLYADGSNEDSSDHRTFGVNAASTIQPLDANGNPSPTGKYVFMAIGQSTTQQAFAQFVPLASNYPAKNANLVIVNGGIGGGTALEYSLLNSAFWVSVVNDLLPNAGVTAKQVAAVWVNTENAGFTGTYPSDMASIQSQFESIAQNLQTLFPNIRIAYYSTLPYTGYSNGIVNLVPEPYSYEIGFAVRSAIEDQVNGNADLNYDPSKGAVLAPWMAWGPYYWANGLLARSDGLLWSCGDFNSDGTHPSAPVGTTKISTLLLDFLTTDDTATPWFLAPGSAQKSHR